ncbi:D-alanyl-D-alanine carboxypeptidase family protein [Sphingomonas sp.]|uniref:D-alanyl-D-alanine carboxypeptidase family protein n=1 Tax=Sphingomonas sp. TaxID=28214 RepID=UPI003CC667B9
MTRYLAAPLAIALLVAPSTAAAPQFAGAAPIAFMEDVSTGAVLYARDADRRMPPASMAKMMTVYVAFDMIKRGQLRLDQTYNVSPDTWRQWHGPAAGSTMFLSVNENVSVENLLKGIVTLSGNDACVVLAQGVSGTEQAFTDRMNETARRLGLANSHFGTSNGWPDNGVTYVSARDLAALATATIRDFPDLYRRFYSLREFTWGHTLGSNADITQANRDPLLGHVAGADGLKTGHTDEAGYGFTGSAEQNGRRLVMVVAGLPTFGARAAESVSFMNWGFAAWQAKPIVAAGRHVADAEVQLGDARTVGLVASQALSVAIPSGASPPLTARVVYEGPLKAPLAKGVHVADLVVTSPGLPEQRLPLVTAAAVGEAGFFRRAWTGLFG